MAEPSQFPPTPAFTDAINGFLIEARHVEEEREPVREDAAMIVGLAATIATYLTRKHRGKAIERNHHL